MERQWQLCVCPICGDITLEIPIRDWESSYEASSGIQGFFPVLDKPRAKCVHGCRFKDEDLNDLEVVDHMYEPTPQR